MDLAQITNQAIAIEIAGHTYLFRELNFEGLGRLQQWIKDHTPHPITSLMRDLKGIKGVSAEDRATLLEGARRDALAWPPKVGTAAGAVALMSTEEGQKAAMLEALQALQPGITREESDALYRALQREAAALKAARKRAGDEEEDSDDLDKLEKATRIYSIAFGKGDPLHELDEPDDLLPKGMPAETTSTTK
jgi:hypothetical protein